MKMQELKRLAEMLDEPIEKANAPESEDKKKCCEDPECECEESEEESEDPVKEAMECLVESERIKADPILMMKVQKELRKQGKAIKSIQDIKDRYVEVTIKTDPEDILDPETGEVAFKSKKVDGEDEE